MKRKSKIISLVVIVLIAVIVGVYFLNKDSQRSKLTMVDLPIENLELNDEYVYDGIKWGTSLNDVKKKLPFEIEELDVMGTTAPEETKLVDYRTEAEIKLDGKSAYSATFKFQDEKFVMASLFFSIKENYQEWYVTQAERLIDLYGPETQIAENQTESLAVKVYRWDAEKTSLQWTAMVKEDGSATISLTVFYRYQE